MATTAVGFGSWMRTVDQVVFSLAGIGAYDIADQTWRDWYDDGYTADEAAREALENEGFPFEDE